MSAATSASAEKAALRASVLAARAGRPAAERAAAGDRLAEAVHRWLAGTAMVALYESFGTEPPTTALLELLARDGIDVIIPVLRPDLDLDWARYGAPATLLGPGAVAEADAVVVPALAVDRAGVRLGRGGGSYDRALARTDRPALALVYDDELLPRLPAEPHDRAVQAVATPSGGLVEL